MAEGSHHGPSPEAYGRVTNSERYRVLHNGADGRLRDLAVVYEVDEAEEMDGSEFAVRAAMVRTASLAPGNSGAPLAVGFTAFPGLVVRFGRWHVEAYPRCGCDACDEDPAALLREFDERVDSLVQGRFQEQLTLSGWLRFSFEGLSSGATRLGVRDALARGAPGRSAWTAWPLA